MSTRNKERAMEITSYYLNNDVTLEETGQKFGITRERVRQIVTREGVIPRIVQAARTYKKRVKKCQSCGKEFYSQWNRTLCGNDACAPDRSYYTEDDLIFYLRRLARKLGHTPTQHDMNSNPGPSHTTYVMRFGSLTAAQEAAGLRPNPRGGWKKAEAA